MFIFFSESGDIIAAPLSYFYRFHIVSSIFCRFPFNSSPVTSLRNLQLVSVANQEICMANNERKIILTAREAADYLRISLFTLSRIEREGLLNPFRTPGGHRRYSLEMLNRYLEENQSPARSYQQT